MVAVLKENKPLQCYVAAAASDKIAQVTASQAVITTMMGGIIIGNMGLSSILGMVSMLPSIIFAILVQDMQESTEVRKQLPRWTKVCLVLGAILIVFFVVIDPSKNRCDVQFKHDYLCGTDIIFKRSKNVCRRQILHLWQTSLTMS